MPASYGIPFGPTFDPNYGPSGYFFSDDFIGSSISATDDAATWDNVSSSGTSVFSASEPFGAVALDAPGTVDDAGIELNGEPFAFDHGRDLLFGVRFKASSATGANLFFGLHTEGFDVGSGASIVSTHIGFHTQGDANLDFSVADGSSQSIVDSTFDLTADTYIIATWKWSAAQKRIRFYVNGDQKGHVDLGVHKLPADLTQMTLGLHCEFDNAATTATVDWVYVAGER